MPAHWTSTGKVLLAELSDDAIRRLYAGERFESGTDKSIDSLDRLLAELAATRERGYAVSLGESEDDVTSVAVALASESGKPLAAVGCAAPQHRLAQDRLADVAAAMRDAVQSFFGGGAPAR